MDIFISIWNHSRMGTPDTALVSKQDYHLYCVSSTSDLHVITRWENPRQLCHVRVEFCVS